MRRRAMMMRGAGNGTDLTDYVQNGLVLHMDGIEKGLTPNDYWDSVVGGHRFENLGATPNKDNYQFEGGEYMTNTSFSNNAPKYNIGTIEVVAESSGNLRIFRPIISSGLCFYQISGGILYTCNGGSSPYLIRTQTKASFSVSGSIRKENGVNMSTKTGTYLTLTEPKTKNCIGTNGSTMFKGKVFSIRIYNRILNENEVMQNLAVDNIRFGLGLTLP